MKDKIPHKTITCYCGQDWIIVDEEKLKELLSQQSNTEGVKELQKKFSNWSKKNFGEPYQTGYRNLLGCMEELGELSHAHLKGEQNIRHTPEEIIELKKDAIGDIFVFLCNYADSQGLQVSDCIDKAWNEIKNRDWTNSLPTEE